MHSSVIASALVAVLTRIANDARPLRVSLVAADKGDMNAQTNDVPPRLGHVFGEDE